MLAENTDLGYLQGAVTMVLSYLNDTTILLLLYHF